MYVLKVFGLRRVLPLIAAAACIVALAGCGSTSNTTAVSSRTADDGDRVADEDHDGDEDHDEDHGDEDHDGEDHDDASGGIGAHVHGEAELFVAWSGGDMVIDLISPAESIFGFEREPSTDEERTIAAERAEALAMPGVIVINAEAGCILAAEVTPVLEVEGTHAEVTTSWFYECDNPDEIRQLDATGLFGAFPGLLDVDAQWASEAGQSATELSPSSTILRFE